MLSIVWRTGRHWWNKFNSYRENSHFSIPSRLCQLCHVILNIYKLFTSLIVPQSKMPKHYLLTGRIQGWEMTNATDGSRSNQFTVNSLYNWPGKNPKLAGVRNSGSLFQSNACNSLQYFCLEFSRCPYYRGVRYSGVSAERALTVSGCLRDNWIMLWCIPLLFYRQGTVCHLLNYQVWRATQIFQDRHV